MYSFDSRVSFSECDMNLNLSVDGLVDYLQDVAIFEGNEGDINIHYLSERHLGWILNSWQIIIERMPRFGEKIVVSTFPYDFRGFLGYRNFVMKTEDGEVLAKADSMWTLLDLEKLRPVRPTEEILTGYQLGEKLDMEYKGRKIRTEGEGVQGKTVWVQASQLDSNRHMNNAEYVCIALSYLPQDLKVKELRVEYRNAAYHNAVIKPMVYTKEDCIQVSLNDENDSPYAIIEFNVTT